MAERLSTIATQAIAKSLGNMAAETFTCGGTLPAPSKVHLSFLNSSGEWNTSSLQDIELKQILQTIDKTCHDAYALDSEKFFTSFQLSESNVLGEISSFLQPELNIRAELFKLNVCISPTGCLAHSDTSSGGSMFGMWREGGRLHFILTKGRAE